MEIPTSGGAKPRVYLGDPRNVAQFIKKSRGHKNRAFGSFPFHFKLTHHFPQPQTDLAGTQMNV
jgi:hypothetical protein